MMLGKLINAALRQAGLEIRRVRPHAHASARLLQKFEASGRIPWSEGYSIAQEALIAATLDDPSLMAAFAGGEHLPPDYGIGIDERCVELPWLFAKLQNVSGKILDAGSSLNHA